MGAEVSRRGVLGGTVAGAAAAALPASPAPAAVSPRVRNRMRTDREWAEFLAGQDLVWKRLPRTWYEGAFLGNGFLAVGVYQEPGANALRFKVDHGEVQDHRPSFGNEWGVARLPVGHLTLEPVGTITGVDLRLDLWNAELRGTIVTDKGRLTIRAIVQNDRGVLVATVAPTSGERGFRWVYHPADSISPRIVREPPPANFPPNPPPVTRAEGEIQVATQPLHVGGQTATAYREKANGPERTILLTVAHSYPESTAEATVLATVRRAAAMPVSSLLRAHREWWHAFYRKSFLSIPDGLLQSFYWIQLYKFACASREDSPVMATTGPWLEPTPWPSVWWNLNVQLEYWAAYGSNHLELDAIPRTLVEHQDILVDALRPEYRDGTMMALRRSTDAQMDDAGFAGAPGRPSPQPEVGDLPWALHNVWLNYRHSMDTDMLREAVFPLLRKAMNYYLKFLFTGDDGKLHLPYTFSPEFGNAPDCNFDLALIRWSCRTLLEAADVLGIDDPLKPRWREVLDDARRLSRRRERVHGRHRRAVRQVAPALLAPARRLPAVPRQLGPARAPRPDREFAQALDQLRGRPARLQLHRRRVDLGADGARQRRAGLPARAGRPVRPAEHHVLRGRPGDRDAAVRRAVASTTCCARAGAASSGSSPASPTSGRTSPCTTSAPRARSWSARCAGAAGPASCGSGASPERPAGCGTGWPGG